MSEQLSREPPSSGHATDMHHARTVRSPPAAAHSGFKPLPFAFGRNHSGGSNAQSWGSSGRSGSSTMGRNRSGWHGRYGHQQQHHHQHSYQQQLQHDASYGAQYGSTGSAAFGGDERDEYEAGMMAATSPSLHLTSFMISHLQDDLSFDFLLLPGTRNARPGMQFLDVPDKFVSTSSSGGQSSYSRTDSMSTSASRTPCRYGNACHRSNCQFDHSQSTSRPDSPAGSSGSDK